MPLLNTRRMLGLAQKHGYAIGHFNTTNLEETQAIVSAAVAMRSPIIIGTSTKALTYAGVDNLSLIVKNLAKAPVPIALHLDHGPDVRWALECIKHGYTSVMIDTSTLDYKSNSAATRKVVSYAHRHHVSVEAEIGVLRGIEDELVVADKDAYLTDPSAAARFVDDTHCDSLAIALGTSHGAHKFTGAARLDLGRLSEIREEVTVPLVLHGASSVYPDMVRSINRLGGKIKEAHGLPDRLIHQAIKRGICKVNTDTDLRLAFTLGVRRHVRAHPETYDIRKTLETAREELHKMVCRKIKLFGSAGTA